jgi:hypothetical protein
VGSGGQRDDVSNSGVTGIAPHMTRLFGTVTPEPNTTLTMRRRPALTAGQCDAPQKPGGTAP